MRVETHQGESAFETLSAQWDELFLASGASPFQSRIWMHAWFKEYGSGKTPFVLSFWEGNDLVGLFPLVKTRAPWRTIRSMGIGPSDYLSILSMPEEARKVAEEALELLRIHKKVDLLDLHQIQETDPLAHLVASDWEEQAKCFVLNLPKSFVELRAGLNKSLRYEVDRRQKGPYKEGRAQILTASDAATGLQYWEIFKQLHESRWKKRGLPGAFIGKAGRFQARVVPDLVEAGILKMSVLFLDQKPVGALYIMHSGSTAYFYQSGFDPEAKAASPGTVLVAHALEHAVNEGLGTFDFLRGDEPYKARWKPETLRKNVRFTMALNRSMGEIGASVNRVGFKIEQSIRKRLEGKGLLA